MERETHTRTSLWYSSWTDNHLYLVGNCEIPLRYLSSSQAKGKFVRFVGDSERERDISRYHIRQHTRYSGTKNFLNTIYFFFLSFRNMNQKASANPYKIHVWKYWSVYIYIIFIDINFVQTSAFIKHKLQLHFVFLNVFFSFSNSYV